MAALHDIRRLVARRSLPSVCAMAVLDPLAPDQRAVVGLVLQQGRSYREIADLLGISRSAVRRGRTPGWPRAAPPDAEVPADEAAQLADFLLGQQDAPGATATRELIADSTDARRGPPASPSACARSPPSACPT